MMMMMMMVVLLILKETWGFGVWSGKLPYYVGTDTIILTILRRSSSIYTLGGVCLIRRYDRRNTYVCTLAYDKLTHGPYVVHSHPIYRTILYVRIRSVDLWTVTIISQYVCMYCTYTHGSHALMASLDHQFNAPGQTWSEEFLQALIAPRLLPPIVTNDMVL